MLIIGFNRPGTLKEVIKSVSKVSPEKLYLAMDGPREGIMADDKKYKNARELLDKIDWCDNICKRYRFKNVGCKINVSEAIDWAFENEEKLIIIEDDIVPSISFFRFCDEMLDYFYDDNRIYQICGFNILQDYQGTQNSYYFTNFPIIWGWAT